MLRGCFVICPACGTANEPGRKFCGECGTRLARTCQNCGFANAPTVRFCGECGTRLDESAAAAASGHGGATEDTGPTAGAVAATGADVTGAGRLTERRVVSVLFADLVGFTARSDGND